MWIWLVILHYDYDNIDYMSIDDGLHSDDYYTVSDDMIETTVPHGVELVHEKTITHNDETKPKHREPEHPGFMRIIHDYSKVNESIIIVNSKQNQKKHNREFVRWFMLGALNARKKVNMDDYNNAMRSINDVTTGSILTDVISRIPDSCLRHVDCVNVINMLSKGNICINANLPNSSDAHENNVALGYDWLMIMMLMRVDCNHYVSIDELAGFIRGLDSISGDNLKNGVLRVLQTNYNMYVNSSDMLSSSCVLTHVSMNAIIHNMISLVNMLHKLYYNGELAELIIRISVVLGEDFDYYMSLTGDSHGVNSNLYVYNIVHDACNAFVWYKPYDDYAGFEFVFNDVRHADVRRDKREDKAMFVRLLLIFMECYNAALNNDKIKDLMRRKNGKVKLIAPYGYKVRELRDILFEAAPNNHLLDNTSMKYRITNLMVQKIINDDRIQDENNKNKIMSQIMSSISF